MASHRQYIAKPRQAAPYQPAPYEAAAYEPAPHEAAVYKPAPHAGLPYRAASSQGASEKISRASYKVMSRGPRKLIARGLIALATLVPGTIATLPATFAQHAWDHWNVVAVLHVLHNL